MKYVNVYLIDRAYGGPEEGGWWYDTGKAIRGFPVATQRRAERVQAIAKRLVVDPNNVGRREISSMASTGRYAVYIEDAPAADYPATRPHYE